MERESKVSKHRLLSAAACPSKSVQPSFSLSKTDAVAGIDLAVGRCQLVNLSASTAPSGSLWTRVDLHTHTHAERQHNPNKI